jgi:hypothetical protein
MKSFLTTLLIATCLIGRTKAQSNMAVGAGVVVALPMGSFGDAANTGFGGTAAFELNFAPQITGVGQIGYISYGTGSSNTSFSSVPLLFGIKYYVVPGTDFYGIGQLGFNFFSTSVDIPSVSVAGFSFGGGSTSASSTEFTFALGAGYEVPVSPKISLDFSGTFNIISDFTNLQLRAGGKVAI